MLANPYIALFLIASIACVGDLFYKKKIPIGYIFFVGILILFSGLRYKTGFDYESYYNNWWMNAQNLSNIASHNKEPVLFLIFYAFGTFGLSYNHALLAISAASIGLKAYFIHKYAPYPFLGLLIFIGDFYLLQEMGQMRSGLAMALLVISLHLLIKNRKRFSFGLYCLACATHISSAPFIIPYYLVKNRIRPNFLLVIISLTFVFIFFYFATKPLIELLATSSVGQVFGISDYTLSVLKNVEGRSLATPGTVFSLLIIFFSLVFRNRLDRTIPYFREFFWLYVFGFAFILISIFLGDPAARTARIFLFYQVVLIPGFIALFSPRHISIFLFFLAILIYSACKFLLVLTTRSDSYLPYQLASFL